MEVCFTVEYPCECKTRVRNVFGEEEVSITFYSSITVFVGANGLGKTQTLKALRDTFRAQIGEERVRYLSSNRIGSMESYRSRTDLLYRSPENFSFGGDDMKQKRHTNETAAGDFFTLDAKKDVYIKVAERLSVLFNRQIYLHWDSGKLKVFFGKTESQEEYSVAAEASGLVNVISILSALYDDAIQVLLIDEPEVSLHPQLQSYILHEMQKVSKKYNKTIILSTHSSSMISFESANSICNLVFFTEGELPKQIDINAPELNNRKLQEFIMRMSQIYKDGFFARRILLVEGASDSILCTFFMQKLNLCTDIAGTQIIPIDGKGQFPAVVKLFRLIGKEVIVLTDLDGYTDDNLIVDLYTNLPNATEIANKQGVESISCLIRDIKTKTAELISETKIDSLRKVYEVHPYWKKYEKGQEINKYISRSMLGMLFTISPEKISEWPNGEKWKQLRIRLETVLDDLEQLGCYILRKGAIESYYNYVPNDIYDEKPSKAIEEISNLENKENEYIEDKYADIVRALKRVSVAKTVDEGYAIRKELLSELPLAIEVLQRSDNEKEIYAAIKQAKGQLSKLFAYSIIHDGNKKGVRVDLESAILDVIGFPLSVFIDDNINQIVTKKIVCRS